MISFVFNDDIIIELFNFKSKMKITLIFQDFPEPEEVVIKYTNPNKITVGETTFSKKEILNGFDYDDLDCGERSTYDYWIASGDSEEKARIKIYLYSCQDNDVITDLNSGDFNLVPIVDEIVANLMIDPIYSKRIKSKVYIKDGVIVK
jgi:hypothetical protein